MQDTELLLSLAEIAGVFVGFGALIAVRSGGPTEPEEVAPLRAVVSLGMLTVVAALAPAAMGRFDLTEHQVWALSSALALVGWIVIWTASARTPEYRAGWEAEIKRTRAGSRPRWLMIVEWAVFVLYLIAVLLAPIVILLGGAPDLEAALYNALVALILLGAAWSLMGLVFMQRRPQPASGPAELPAPGDSSA